MRIGFIIDQLGRAGTELQICRLSLELQRRGQEVQILVLGDVSAEVAALVIKMRGAGIKVDVLGRRPVFSQLAQCVRLARRWRNAAGIDILHGVMSWSSVVTAILTFDSRNPPTVMSRRSLVSVRDDSFVASAVRKWAIRRADLIVANAVAVQADSATSEKIPIERFVVIPNALHESAFDEVIPSCSKSDHPLIVSVANLRAPKGHAVLLGAMRILRDAGNPVTTMLVGDGPLRVPIRQSADEYNLDCRFVGNVQDPRPYVRAARVYVQASEAEGASNALMEAMAAGSAIVATDVGGTRELLANCGWLIPPRDSAALATAISELLKSPQLRIELGQKARRRAQMFSPSKAVEAHIKAYQELAQR